MSEAHPACRFYVEIEGKPGAVFTEVSGLAVEMAVEEIEEGGNNGFTHRRPGRCKVGNLTLKRGVTANNDFFKWIMKVAQGQIEPCNLDVVLYKTTGDPLLRWSLIKAYPIKWSGPQFKADDNAVAIESLELAHQGFQLT